MSPPLLAAALLTTTAFALAPPARTGLCAVTGTVVATGTAEGTDERMRRLTVPTITVRIGNARPAGIDEPSYIDCGTLLPNQVRTFRNCDETPFTVGQQIEGIVGRSKGGGPHCLQQSREPKR